MNQERKASTDKVAKEESVDTASEAFASLLESVGDYGKWQWKICFITGFCGIFTGLQNFAAVLLAARPDHWCKIPSSDFNASYAREIHNLTTPWVRSNDGHLIPSSCEYIDVNSTDSNTTITQRCHSWFYDQSIYESTIISEWDLVCDKEWLRPTTQSTYMMGILSGAVIFSSLSDSLGRRPTSLLAIAIFFASSNAVAFSNSLPVFLSLRFLVAASGQGLALIVFILCMEVLGTEARALLGILCQIGFSIGLVSFSGIGYYVRDWRNLQTFLSAPSVLLFSYYWVLPESPRWLLINGRAREAREIFGQIARCNGKPELDQATFKKMQQIIEKQHASKDENMTLGQKLSEVFEKMLMLVRTPNMRRRNCVTFYAWFVTSMIYYGLAFNGANINASVYVNLLLSGLVEIPSIFVTIIFVKRYGRRWGLFFGMILGGIACTSIAFVPHESVGLNVALASIGKFMANASFCIIFLFSSELVPTSVRNISIGIASMWGRVGSGICPYIVDLLGDIYYSIPSIIFGAAALICGLLALLLPEPGKDKLPESIEEIEKLPK